MSSDAQFEPWRRIQPLSAHCCRELRQRAIFECCKWDPQVEDVDTLAPMAVVLKRAAWLQLRQVAEQLTAETLTLEHALARRPDLHKELALPRPIRKVLRGFSRQHECSSGHVRVMRFDFHPTAQGWRLSEVNSDVPGGYNEASGWTSLVSGHLLQCKPAEDPVTELAKGIAGKVPPGGTVALVHATAYTDDRQVMTFLARRLQQHGFLPVLLAPDHIHWDSGIARIRTHWFSGPADFVFRFFPAEWLPNLGRAVDWPCFLGNTRTPLCNPATALLTQSKRWPLISDQLDIDLPAWRQLLPETQDPRCVDWRHDNGWVLKPALGRVGELIGMADVTGQREWKTIKRALRWGARHWVAQRRFASQPILADGHAWHICIGVYTINGRAAGIYGRIAERPLINHLARDVAVLVEDQEQDHVPDKQEHKHRAEAGLV